MNRETDTYFRDAGEYPEAFTGIYRYDSTEIRDLEMMFDQLWGDDRSMRQWRLDILYHYLLSGGRDTHRLPEVDLYNYTL